VGPLFDVLSPERQPAARRAVRDLILQLGDWRTEIESARESFARARSAAAELTETGDDAPLDSRTLARAAARRQRKVLSAQAQVHAAMSSTVLLLNLAHASLAPTEHEARKAIRRYTHALLHAQAKLPAPSADASPGLAGGSNRVAGSAQRTPTAMEAPGAAEAASAAEAQSAAALAAMREFCQHTRAIAWPSCRGPARSRHTAPSARARGCGRRTHPRAPYSRWTYFLFTPSFFPSELAIHVHLSDS